MARKIQVEIVGDASKLQRAFRDAGNAGSRFGSTLRTLGKIAAVGVGGAFVGLFAVLKSGFGEFMEAQKVVAQTNAVLKSTGSVAKVTAKQVEALSESLSAMSGVDDELIQNSENILLTFKRVRNELGRGNKIFQRATKASLDLSKAGGGAFGDLNSASKMLGKALNDPIRGMTALSRAGITFSTAQRATIKELVESNRALAAQKLILREVESQVGGSARAFGSTLPGALGKLRNSFENLTGALVTGLAPMVIKVADSIAKKFADPRVIKRITEIGNLVGDKLRVGFEAIGRWFEQNWDDIKTGFRVAGEILKGTVTVVKELAEAFQFLLRLGKPVFQVFIIQVKILLALFSGLSRAMSHLPFIGDRFSGVAEKIDAIRQAARGAEDALNRLASAGQGKSPSTPAAPSASPRVGPPKRRASGGPVMPGRAYRVGERGPETFVPSTSGNIVPNGGGSGGGDVVLVLDGAEIARVSLGHLQRMAKNGTSQTRGRSGGQKLAVL